MACLALSLVAETLSTSVHQRWGPESVRNLEIWRDAVALVKETYALSRAWPKEEFHGLTAQARRAAVSVPVNLAEGIGRGTPAETARFCQIAVGSLYELDTLLELAGQLGCSQAAAADGVRRNITDLTRRIATFIRYQRSRRK